MPSPNPTSAAAIAAGIIPQMNTPTAPAEPAAVASTAPEPAAGSPKLDAKGTPFDPLRHTGAIHGKTGCWMPRRRTAAAAAAPRPSASFIPSPGQDRATIDRQEEPPDSIGLDSRRPASVGEVVENATAETAVAIVQMILVLIGEEEGVLSDAEKTLLRQPLIRILDKYKIGRDVLPAEVEFLAAVASIVIDRIKRRGKTATWFARVKAWIAHRLWRREGAALGRKVQKEIPADLVASLQEEVRRLRDEAAPAGAKSMDRDPMAA